MPLAVVPSWQELHVGEAGTPVGNTAYVPGVCEKDAPRKVVYVAVLVALWQDTQSDVVTT